MKYLGLVVMACLLFLGVTACDETPTDTDKIAPYPAKLLPHLGDAGGDSLSTTHYAEDTYLSDDNNGIDAVTDGDNIRIMWGQLRNTDIDYIEVYRYQEIDSHGNIDEVMVESISYDVSSPISAYKDTQLGIHTNPIGIKWYYYLKVYDTSENFSISDTVSYELMNKPQPLFPGNGYVHTAYNPLTFRWQQGGNETHCRVLLFDVSNDQHKLVWPNAEHESTFEDKDWYFLEQSEPQLEFTEAHIMSYGQEFVWRVDSFGANPQEKGAESVEIYFTTEPDPNQD